jgi:hypothetical protein
MNAHHRPPRPWTVLRCHQRLLRRRSWVLPREPTERRVVVKIDATLHTYTWRSPALVRDGHALQHRIVAPLSGTSGTSQYIGGCARPACATWQQGAGLHIDARRHREDGGRAGNTRRVASPSGNARQEGDGCACPRASEISKKYPNLASTFPGASPGPRAERDLRRESPGYLGC